MLGFDFARDPLNAKRPMQPAEEIVKQDTADKPIVTNAQRELLQRRYDLTPKLDSTVKMSRGSLCRLALQRDCRERHGRI